MGGLASANSGRERFAGYEQALREHGLEVDPEMVERGPFSPAFGAEGTRALLDRKPTMTALFAANHEAVFGVLPTLVSRGVRLPEDLSLICHEDISWLRSWQPAVTVVDNGADELGRLCFDLLLRQMRESPESGQAPGRVYRVEAGLVERNSCAQPRTSPLLPTTAPARATSTTVPPQG